MRSRGFSLLELTIALVVIAAITAIVAPAGGRWVEARRAAEARLTLGAMFETLPARARQTREPLLLPAGDLAEELPMPVPEGWSVELLDPLRVSSTGICGESRVALRSDATVETYRVAAPLCRLIATDVP